MSCEMGLRVFNDNQRRPFLDVPFGVAYEDGGRASVFFQSLTSCRHVPARKAGNFQGCVRGLAEQRTLSAMCVAVLLLKQRRIIQVTQLLHKTVCRAVAVGRNTTLQISKNTWRLAGSPRGSSQPREMIHDELAACGIPFLG